MFARSSRAVRALKELAGRTFYAVGGTWRALARLHMRQRQYPMNVMHNYVIPSRDALEFAALVERIEADALLSIESVSSARRPLLAYGAAVLEEIIRQSSPKEIVVSALGVREGLIYSRLTPQEQAEDPLIVSAREFNQLRSRAPKHGEELYAWTSRLIASTHLEEDDQDRRLRHAACLLSDISWRAHPDYRGAQAYDLVANAAFIGVDHPSRAFLALAASYRHMSSEDVVSPQSRALVTARQLDRARLLGAAMRVAYNISAAMPGVLPRAPMVCAKGRVILTLPADLGPAGRRATSVAYAAVCPSHRGRTGDPRVCLSLAETRARRRAIAERSLVQDGARFKTDRSAKRILYARAGKLVPDLSFHRLSPAIGQTCIHFVPTANFFATLSKGSANRMMRELRARRSWSAWTSGRRKRLVGTGYRSSSESSTERASLADWWL